jgi:branched-chain amino acid transport system permease protein
MPSLDQLSQYLVTGITSGAIYAIVALGFTIIFSVTGVINFAQGEFVMLGGMVSYWLLSGLNLPAPLAFVLSVVIVTLVGIALERLAIRTARGASAVSLIIITIGASIFIRGIAGQLWGKDAVALPPFTGETPIAFLGARINPQSLWVIGVTLVMMLALQLLFKFTMLGKALRACSSNPMAASLLGVNAKTMSLFSFGLSACMGAIAGIVIAPIAFTSYGVGTTLGLKGFAAAALGGFESHLLAVVGGLVLGIAEAIGASRFSAYKDAIAMVVLFLVLYIRFGRSARK